jgi:hypothetical protein
MACRTISTGGFLAGTWMGTITFAAWAAISVVGTGRPDADYAFIIAIFYGPILVAADVGIGTIPFLLVRQAAPSSGGRRLVHILSSFLLIAMCCRLVEFAIMRPRSYSPYFYAPPPPFLTDVAHRLAAEWHLLLGSAIVGGFVCWLVDRSERSRRRQRSLPHPN